MRIDRQRVGKLRREQVVGQELRVELLPEPLEIRQRTAVLSGVRQNHSGNSGGAGAPIVLESCLGGLDSSILVAEPGMNLREVRLPFYGLVVQTQRGERPAEIHGVTAAEDQCVGLVFRRPEVGQCPLRPVPAHRRQVPAQYFSACGFECREFLDLARCVVQAVPRDQCMDAGEIGLSRQRIEDQRCIEFCAYLRNGEVLAFERERRRAGNHPQLRNPR